MYFSPEVSGYPFKPGTRRVTPLIAINKAAALLRIYLVPGKYVPGITYMKRGIPGTRYEVPVILTNNQLPHPSQIHWRSSKCLIRRNIASPHLLPCDGDHITQLSGFAVDLDAIVQELLERSRVQNAILHGHVAVDYKLDSLLLRGLLRLRLKATEGREGRAAWGKPQQKRIAAVAIQSEPSAYEARPPNAAPPASGAAEWPAPAIRCEHNQQYARSLSSNAQRGFTSVH